MRKIQFRGKSINTGEWLYGDLTFYAGGAQIWEQREDGKWNYPIAPDTIGQFTGLKDRHGNRIFEGDIVNYNDTAHKVIFETRGYNGYFGIVMSEIETWGFCTSVPPNMMEVLGNVYDNPELLTQSGTA